MVVGGIAQLSHGFLYVIIFADHDYHGLLAAGLITIPAIDGALIGLPFLHVEGCQLFSFFAEVSSDSVLLTQHFKHAYVGQHPYLFVVSMYLGVKTDSPHHCPSLFDL